MKKIKIRTLDQFSFGNKINLPIDGEVQLDESGVVEVSEECAKQMSAPGGGNWVLVKENDNEEEENEEVVDKLQEEVINALNSLELADLKEIALKLEIPEKEVEAFGKRKVNIIKYITKKIDISILANILDINQ